MKFNSDLFGFDPKNLKSFTGAELDPNAYLNPCGLIAAFFFNDTFLLYNSDDEIIPINETGIAYKTDKKYMYKRNSNPNLQWIDVENEHLMVWMNMELFPNFIKKWGHIDQVLPKGSYFLKINWNWDSKAIETGKYFVLAEGQLLGTERLYGYILLTGTILSLLMVIIMSVKGCHKVKKFNPKLMAWD